MYAGWKFHSRPSEPTLHATEFYVIDENRIIAISPLGVLVHDPIKTSLSKTNITYAESWFNVHNSWMGSRWDNYVDLSRTDSIAISIWLNNLILNDIKSSIRFDKILRGKTNVRRLAIVNEFRLLR